MKESIFVLCSRLAITAKKGAKKKKNNTKLASFANFPNVRGRARAYIQTKLYMRTCTLFTQSNSFYLIKLNCPITFAYI